MYRVVKLIKYHAQSVGTIDLKPRAGVSYKNYKNLCRQEAQLSLAAE